MRDFIIKIQLQYLFAGLFTFLLFVVGCNKSEVNKRKDMNNILPLIGTTWKLVGFGNVKRYPIEPVEPSGKETYLLTFMADGSINGITCTNQAGGTYTLSSLNRLTLSHFGPIADVNELFNGRRYIEAINEVSSYQISSRGLSLYYGKDTYLFFRSVE